MDLLSNQSRGFIQNRMRMRRGTETEAVSPSFDNSQRFRTLGSDTLKDMTLEMAQGRPLNSELKNNSTMVGTILRQGSDLSSALTNDAASPFMFGSASKGAFLRQRGQLQNSVLEEKKFSLPQHQGTRNGSQAASMTGIEIQDKGNKDTTGYLATDIRSRTVLRKPGGN